MGLVLGFVTLLGGAACSGNDHGHPTSPPRTTAAPDPAEVLVATATGAELEVLGAPPADADADVPTAPPTTLTRPPTRELPANSTW